MQNRKYSTRDHINGAAAARDTNNELPPLARPPTPRGEWRQLIAHRRPPSTPTRGVPSGHLGEERCSNLAHWLHRIRKPSRERRGGSFGGSAKDAHGE